MQHPRIGLQLILTFSIIQVFQLVQAHKQENKMTQQKGRAEENQGQKYGEGAHHSSFCLLIGSLGREK